MAKLRLVLAASPECLVALPNSKAMPGPAAISIDVAGNARDREGSTLVALEFDAPQPAFLPGKNRGWTCGCADRSRSSRWWSTM